MSQIFSVQAYWMHKYRRMLHLPKFDEDGTRTRCFASISNTRESKKCIRKYTHMYNAMSSLLYEQMYEKRRLMIEKTQNYVFIAFNKRNKRPIGKNNCETYNFGEKLKDLLYKIINSIFLSGVWEEKRYIFNIICINTYTSISALP